MKKIAVLLLCLVLFLTACSGMAAAKKKEAPRDKGTIVYIPHDNRPISDVETADTIRQLGYKVVVPPDELLGSKNNIGDADKLWQWLEDNTTARHQGRADIRGFHDVRQPGGLKKASYRPEYPSGAGEEVPGVQGFPSQGTHVCFFLDYEDAAYR